MKGLLAWFGPTAVRVSRSRGVTSLHDVHLAVLLTDGMRGAMLVFAGAGERRAAAEAAGQAAAATAAAAPRAAEQGAPPRAESAAAAGKQERQLELKWLRRGQWLRIAQWLRRVLAYVMTCPTPNIKVPFFLASFGLSPLNLVVLPPLSMSLLCFFYFV